MADKIPPVVTINNPAKVNFNNQVNYTLSGGCTVDDNDPVVIMITTIYDKMYKWNKWRSMEFTY